MNFTPTECPKNSFSCDDWLTYKQETKATCLPMDKRCDNVVDCPNGKDERDCELLVDNIFSNDNVCIMVLCMEKWVKIPPVYYILVLSF